jgi:2,3-bisphosphoglycerate-independent phosphoglycerate mutase
MENKKAALVILDGWGIGVKDEKINAVESAKPKFFNSLLTDYPSATLKTFGSYVGLPDGQMGNSEVGHLNIGAGRIVYQMLALINKALLKDNILETLPVFQQFISDAKNKRIHLIGLVSDGGVHSHIDHLKALIHNFKTNHTDFEIFLHLFTDGRDTDPKSGLEFIKEVNTLTNDQIKIATVIGRYYAMDRDKRWERTALAYNALVNRTGVRTSSSDLLKSIENEYQLGITDEFLNPIIVGNNEQQLVDGSIKEADSVLFFNFRTDRGRQLTQALSQMDIPDYQLKKLNLNFLTFTQYDKTYNNVKVMFLENDLHKTIGQVVSDSNRTQLRVAETEKYPHVTFFFNGGREEPFINESRLMVPSPKVATYDLQPEMSAVELTNLTLEKLKNDSPDLLVLNFANPDMVGHTGVFNAVKKAILTVDDCLNRLVNQLLEQDYSIIVIADHGNAEFMVNPDGSPNTAHTTNLVPVILVTKSKIHQIKDGVLADISPTLLDLMDIPQPQEMSGNSLLN